jgi:hypothetical protein
VHERPSSRNRSASSSASGATIALRRLTDKILIVAPLAVTTTLLRTVRDLCPIDVYVPNAGRALAACRGPFT